LRPVTPSAGAAAHRVSDGEPWPASRGGGWMPPSSSFFLQKARLTVLRSELFFLQNSKTPEHLCVHAHASLRADNPEHPDLSPNPCDSNGATAAADLSTTAAQFSEVNFARARPPPGRARFHSRTAWLQCGIGIQERRLLETCRRRISSGGHPTPPPAKSAGGSWSTHRTVSAGVSWKVS